MKMNFPSFFLVPLLAALSPALATAESTAGTSAKTLTKSGCPATLDYSFRKLSDAKSINLCDTYKGQVTLIVNTASRCGFTPQFAELETLYNTYKPRGFTVLGFPSNDFGSQDPGTEKEIATFCSRTYGVKFPMFEKTHADALSSFSQLKNAGLLVVDTQGRAIRADNNQRSFIPASTTKLVTAWLALNRWGENHRFQTNFYFDQQTKTLSVFGGGDPFLVSEEIAIIASQLRQLGLDRVDTLVLDGSMFTDGLILPGTSRTNNPYDAVPSALAANFNTVNLKKVGGKVRSAEAQTPLTPFAKSLARGFKKKTLRVNTGRKPQQAERYFGELLLAMLKKQGIPVSNRIVHGSKEWFWNTTARSGPGSFTSLPSRIMPPSVAWYKPATIFNTVDLPQPECPIMETNSPLAIFRLTLSSARYGPFGVGKSIEAWDITKCSF